LKVSNVMMKVSGQNGRARNNGAVVSRVLCALAILFPAAVAECQDYGEMIPRQPAPPSFIRNVGRVYSKREVTKSAVLRSKPEPKYTEKAREHNTQGTVILRLIFTSKGRVIYYQTLSGLPDGLTREAIEAALKIKFDPATKDGKRVSQWAQVMYDFNLY
jgi:TonB family protein